MSIPGTFFRGTVLKSDPVSYLVEVSPQDITLSAPKLKGICVVPFFSKYFGFREAALPEPDSMVFCYQLDVSNCLILGSIVTPDNVFKGAPLRTVQKAVDSIYDTMNKSGMDDGNRVYPHNNNRPSDVVEGERVLTNEFGIMLQLMQQFAAIKASDLAQVQAHLLDDLVRIVSHNFQHYTSLGGMQIYHDGKYLHAEYGATDKPQESLGRPVVESGEFKPVFKSIDGRLSTSNDENDCYGFVEEREESITAVERFKAFIGTLGDFFNFFITRPHTDNVYLLNGSDPAKDDVGLLQVKASLDGGFYLRSAKEVFIEKTNWIRVPVRIRTFEDPEGTDGSTVEILDKQLFQFNKEYAELGTPYLYALQMQDYAAYVQEELGYQNFKAYFDDIYLPKDVRDYNNLSEIKRVDPKTPTELYPVKSGVYLMPNGGILFKDAWSSAIVMEGGNIYFQPAKDIIMQPGRHLIGKVGGSYNMEVNNHIDYSSATKGMRLKTEQSQYFYSRQGGVILHSDTVNPTLSPADEAIENIGGVVLKSNTAIYSLAENINSVATNTNIVTNNLIARAENLIQLNAASDAGSVVIASGASTFVSGRTNVSVISEGSLTVLGENNTLIGSEDQTIGMGVFNFNGEELPIPVNGLINADDAISGASETITQVLEFNPQEAFPIFYDQEAIDSLIFRYLSTSAYGGVSEIPMTLAQQTDTTFQTYNYVKWYAGADPSVNDTLPYPGADEYAEAYVTSPGLENSQMVDGVIYAKVEDLKKEASLTKRSLLDYTVYPSN